MNKDTIHQLAYKIGSDIGKLYQRLFIKYAMADSFVYSDTRMRIETHKRVMKEIMETYYE